MLRSSIWFGFFILYGALAENIFPQVGFHDNIPHTIDQTSRTGRFGFSLLDKLRQHFCQSFCTSADTSSYIVNALCAIKCPELYLPHYTTKSTISTSTAIIKTSEEPTVTSTTTRTTSVSTTSATSSTTSPITSPTPSTTTSSTTTNTMPMMIDNAIQNQTTFESNENMSAMNATENKNP